MDRKNDTILRPFMLHLHNPRPQDHHQNLRCWLYAQQLKQVQDNYQTYTQKGTLNSLFGL